MEILKRFQKIVADAEASNSVREGKQIIVSEDEPTYTTPIESFRALDRSQLTEGSLANLASQHECDNQKNSQPPKLGSPHAVKRMFLYLLIVIPLCVVALVALFNMMSFYK